MPILGIVSTRTEHAMNWVNFLRFGFMGLMGIFMVVWGAIQYLRGVVGAEDVSFLVLRFPRNPGEMIHACTARTYKFRPIIENAFLGLCASYCLMRGKGILKAPKMKWQRALMSPFDDIFSEIANGPTVLQWTCSPCHREVEFVFWVTDVKSNRGRRKIRAVAFEKSRYLVLKEEFDLLELLGRKEAEQEGRPYVRGTRGKEAVEKLPFHPDLEFLKRLFPQMLSHPEASGGFSYFEPLNEPPANC